MIQAEERESSKVLGLLRILLTLNSGNTCSPIQKCDNNIPHLSNSKPLTTNMFFIKCLTFLIITTMLRLQTGPVNHSTFLWRPKKIFSRRLCAGGREERSHLLCKACFHLSGSSVASRGLRLVIGECFLWDWVLCLAGSATGHPVD